MNERQPFAGRRGRVQAGAGRGDGILTPWLRRLAGGLLVVAMGTPLHAGASATQLDPLQPEVGGLIDRAMYHAPVIDLPQRGRTFHPRLKTLWLEALNQPEAYTRIQAIRAFQQASAEGMSDLDDVAERLVALVRSDDSDAVRLAAVELLTALDWSASADVMLERADAAQDDEFVLAVDRALAQWDHEPARAWWLDRLSDEQGSRTRRRSAIRALAAVQASQAVQPLRQLVMDPAAPMDLRLPAADALGHVAEQGLADDARSLLDPRDASPLHRLMAARMLAGHADDAALSLVERLARDEDPTVASKAMANLNQHAPARAAALAPARLEHADANVRLEAMRAVAAQQSAEAAATLAQYLGDLSPAVRTFARETLEQYDEDNSLNSAVRDLIEQTLAEDDWRALEQAALLATQLDHKPVAPRLAELLSHDRPEVRLASAHAMGVLAVEETLPAIEARAEALSQQPREGNDDEDTAATVARHRATAYELMELFLAMGEMRYTQADALLRRYVPKGSGDSQVRSAAIWALGRVHEGDPDSQLARQLSERMTDNSSLEPESEDVQRFAAIALGQMGATDQVETLREVYRSSEWTQELREASRWSLERLTDESLEPIRLSPLVSTGWFLEPID